jgi:hypothetical protein
MRTQSTMLALAALLACSACADQSPVKAALAGDSSVQISSIRWDEATAATQSARVNNNGLIIMR